MDVNFENTPAKVLQLLNNNDSASFESITKLVEKRVGKPTNAIPLKSSRCCSLSFCRTILKYKTTCYRVDDFGMKSMRLIILFMKVFELEFEAACCVGSRD